MAEILNLLQRLVEMPSLTLTPLLAHTSRPSTMNFVSFALFLEDVLADGQVHAHLHGLVRVRSPHEVEKVLKADSFMTDHRFVATSLLVT